MEWPGGREMAGGQARLNVQEADPLSWTQVLPLIDATKELPLAWQVRGPSEQIFFTGIFLAPESETAIALGGFHCKVPADARAFTIPASVMEGMPSTVADGLAIIAIESRTSVTPFSANLQQMEGELDYGVFDQRFAVVKVREYRR